MLLNFRIIVDELCKGSLAQPTRSNNRKDCEVLAVCFIEQYLDNLLLLLISRSANNILVRINHDGINFPPLLWCFLLAYESKGVHLQDKFLDFLHDLSQFLAHPIAEDNRITTREEAYRVHDKHSVVVVPFLLGLTPERLVLELVEDVNCLVGHLLE